MLYREYHLCEELEMSQEDSTAQYTNHLIHMLYLADMGSRNQSAVSGRIVQEDTWQLL